MTKTAASQIVVLGSLNMDLVVTADRAPGAGETLAARGFNSCPGGKGANQAVAIARAGGRVAMIGCVGADDHGHRLKSNLAAAGVDTTHVATTSQTTTGMALIVVEQSGENRILLVAGANGVISEADVAAAESVLARAGALVLQMEIPWAVNQYALRLARDRQIPTVLNLAPAYPLPDEMLRLVSYLVLNESEIEVLTGAKVVDLLSAERAVASLRDRGCQVVILTLGSRGALLATAQGTAYFPPHRVDVVDTTAAGDAFVGNFVAALINTGDLATGMRWANAAGALAVTRPGAQDSLPSGDDVRQLLQSEPLAR